jgi:hypothetical protein
MKKITLLFAMIMIVLTSARVQAQSFRMDKGDTSKMNWVFPGGDMQIFNKIINKTSAYIKVQWHVVDYHMDPGWDCGGICDNITCYTWDDNLKNGVTKNVTDTITPNGPIFDNHVILNGNSAAGNTKGWIRIRYKDIVSMDSTEATFVGYKMGSGVSIVRYDDNVTIFPNPAQNYIDVLYTSSADVKTISIYNIIGKLVSVYRVSSNTSAHCEFNNDMPSGIYLVRLADSKGNVVATRKFTRQ